VKKTLKGRKPKKHRKKLICKFRIALFFIFSIVISIVIYLSLDKKIMPIVMNMAYIKANTIATHAISNAINDVFKEVTVQDLVIYDYNEGGEVISWTLNTPVVNELSANIITGVSKELEEVSPATFKVPLGNITGNRIFANVGPEIGIKVLPLGTAVINYDREFRSTGINQINHTVWLNIDTMVQVVIPLSSEQIKVSRKVILIDKVLSGKVPPTYVEFHDPFKEPKIFDYSPIN